jgi:pimeloyl-ACP methyl ester carboxylesterase
VNAKEDVMPSVSDHTIALGSVNIHYRQAGEDGLPPLIVLHGLGGKAEEWDHVSLALADRYHVLVLAQRGHGTSSWPGEYSFELMRDDLEAFADALSFPHFSLIGHSMGATVAYLFAEKWPERIQRLVCVDTAPPSLDRAASIDSWAGDDEDEEEQSAEPLPFDEPVWTAIIAQLRRPDPAWWSELPQISAPTLIIGGGPTSHVPKEQLAEAAALIPDCRLMTIPDAGHVIHFTRPAEFIALLRDFLLP